MYNGTSYVCRLSISGDSLHDSASEPQKSAQEKTIAYVNYKVALSRPKFMQLHVRDLERVALFLLVSLQPSACDPFLDTDYRGGPTAGPCVLQLRFETGVVQTIPFDFVRFCELPTRVGSTGVVRTSTLLSHGRTSFVFMEERLSDSPRGIVERMQVFPIQPDGARDFRHVASMRPFQYSRQDVKRTL